MTRDAFGPNLRRIRVQRGITLQQIASNMKIPADLLAGLERNDFSAWPTGIYARAFVRQYAYAIGVDPDVTVDEFCRWFPQGDRRAERVVREQSEIVGHALEWKDEVPPTVENERRGRPKTAPREAQSPIGTIVMRLRRAFGKP